MIRGVIFDMDGLMTDTERLFLKYWCQVMRELGYPEHEEIVRHCAGLNYQDTMKYVYEQLGSEFNYDSILRRASSLSRNHCNRYGVPVKPGLYELLDYLDHAHISYAVATSAELKDARYKLESIGVWSRIRCIVTGDMVSRGKPDPELFQITCRRLALPPDECIVLEDSVYGIHAAHLAGCLPVMIPDLQSPDNQTTSILFSLVESLDQVILVLENANRA